MPVGALFGTGLSVYAASVRRSIMKLALIILGLLGTSVSAYAAYCIFC
jgi:hypothetical protein